VRPLDIPLPLGCAAATLGEVAESLAGVASEREQAADVLARRRAPNRRADVNAGRRSMERGDEGGG
jgi:hypothetical protein